MKLFVFHLYFAENKNYVENTRDAFKATRLAISQTELVDRVCLSISLMCVL